MAILIPLAIVGAAVGAALAFDRIYTDRVLPGVSVAGIDASGLTAPELTARLEALPLSPEVVEITTGGRRVSVSPADLGRRVDVSGAVAAALAAGRVGGPLADVPQRLALLRDGQTIEQRVSFDRAALTAWVAERAKSLLVTPRSAQIRPTTDGWMATTPRYGKELDQAAAVAAIEAALTKGTEATARVDLPLTILKPDIDETDAAEAIAAAERIAQPLTLKFRSEMTWTIPAAAIRAVITWQAGPDRPIPVVDPAVFSRTLAGIAKKVDRPAKETLLLKTRSGSIFGYVPGKNGRYVDRETTATQLADLLTARGAGTVAAAVPSSLVMGVKPPELTTDEAAGRTHQVALVGAWTTRFVSSERNHFGANIRIPARLINGTVIGPGQTFDFWRAVGPVTFARGFGMGGIIESGRTNPTGAIGGGICSASTTMFNAAIRAGYQVLERDQHAYYINRYPLGLDATVSKFHGQISQNMRFRNDTSHALYIRGLSGSGFVRFEIYSVPNGRTVTFTKPAVSNVLKASDEVVRTSSLRKGQSERVEYPTNGMNVVVYRTVRSASGAVIHHDRFESHYIRVNGLLKIGTG